MKEIKKAFQKMYKEYNKINNTELKGNFREKNKIALISFGKYHVEDGIIQDKYNGNHGDKEKEWEKQLQRDRDTFMRSKQFKEFINFSGATYTEENNINWNVGYGITVMTKQIRFKF
ncbi:hypothetical protein EJM73_09200 [Clostridium botulinum]|uniref:hypothetical protein n=1 Tax=Clostridium botulinum TaxID=1491 RepID=UPI001376381E|nr:hypothetical protein [Clostridium botulinum]NCI19802.1 hypothetical protein [Clostridium botulinum]NCI35840.1 hypothetical protein [Clostridium botulinum]NCI71697.1 hypothetical protein [Clostridium botulinum]NDI38889.1 hypothetical protein [Clostridium botulinum]